MSSDSEYSDDEFVSHNQSKDVSTVKSSAVTSRSGSTVSSSSASSSSSSSSGGAAPTDKGGVLHQSNRTVVSKLPDEKTTYHKLDHPDTVEDLAASGNFSDQSISDHFKSSESSVVSKSTPSSSPTPKRKEVGSAPSGRQPPRNVNSSSTSGNIGDRLHRADSTDSASRRGRKQASAPSVGMLPPLSKQHVVIPPSPGGMSNSKSSPQVSPARSNQSRGGVHSSAATVRTSLLDRVDDLKDEIKEIESRIAKRQRELDRWKSLTSNTSQRRRRFVDKLVTENEILEKKLEKYDGQVVNVAFLIARTEEQLHRAEARLKEVTKIKRALTSRDKRAAHTIEVVHRYMPSAEELETREVNETIYSCASLEKKVANARDTLHRTQESLELMNRNCERLQREVDRRNIASMPVKQYEELRATQEEQEKEIQRLRESISIYINAVNSERARVASNGLTSTPRPDNDGIPDKVRELQRKREKLEEQVEEIKKTIDRRIQKINTNKQYMEQFRKKRFDGEDGPSALPSSVPRDRNETEQAKSAKKAAALDPIEQALKEADEATRRIKNEVHFPKKGENPGRKELSQGPSSPTQLKAEPSINSALAFMSPTGEQPTPGKKAAKVLAQVKLERANSDSARKSNASSARKESSSVVNPNDTSGVAEDEEKKSEEQSHGGDGDEEGFVEEELEEDLFDFGDVSATNEKVSNEPPGSGDHRKSMSEELGGVVEKGKDDDASEDLGDSDGDSTPSWLN